TDTLYMRPIFSGATDNSNIDHEIQFWIDKFGLETEEVTGTTDQQRVRVLEEDEDDEDDEYDDEDEDDDSQTIYFYANGTNTYSGDSN
ncbi:hypothetical protein BBJ28_00002909, partial [Nothophytophthora sp. Chile5]